MATGAPSGPAAAPKAAQTNTRDRADGVAAQGGTTASTVAGPGAGTAEGGTAGPGGSTSVSTDSRGQGADGGETTTPGGESGGAPAAGGATPETKTVQPGGGSAAGTAQCSDPTGEATTESLGDMDLTAVELSRDTDGLRVRFRLNGPVPADAGLVAGSPATNLWQLLLASGDEVLYAFSVTEHGTVWETSLVDFASANGDRLGTISAQSGATVEALIPNAQLSRLPASFTWWALTNTDRKVPTGPYIGDDCPNGTGDLDPTQLLPPESSRGAFFG